MWELWTGALFGLVLWLVTGGGEVQAGEDIGFTEESFPDSQTDYAACGRPRPSWVCDPGHFLTELQGDGLDESINGEGGQGRSGTIQIMVVPRLVGIYGNATGDVARDQFGEYQYAKMKSVNGTSVNLIVYFVDRLVVWLKVDLLAEPAECFCSALYQTKEFMSQTGLLRFLATYSYQSRFYLRWPEKCSSSTQNQPWMIDARGRCTWEKLVTDRQFFLHHYMMQDGEKRRIKISPTFGPRQGGTLVQINSINLDISKRDVLIGTLRCEVLSRSSTLLTCRTAPLDNSQTTNSALIVYLLLENRKLKTGLRFTYSDTAIETTPPTTITTSSEITDKTTPPTTITISRGITIKTIRPTTIMISGGLKLTVEGRNLDLVMDAFLLTKVVGMSRRIKAAEYKTTCETANSTHMYCVTPKLDMDSVTGPSHRRRKRRMNRRELTRWREVERDRRQVTRQRRQAGVESGSGKSQSVDGVNVTVTLEVNGNVLSLSDSDGHPVSLHLYEDPHLFAFETEGDRMTFIPVWPQSQRQIEIKGTGLLPVLEGHDIVVKIGDGKCLVKIPYTNLLVCNPPLTEPKAAGSDPAVQALVGSLPFDIGFLEYQDNPWKYPPTRYAIIAGIGVVVVSGVVATICLTRFLIKRA